MLFKLCYKSYDFKPSLAAMKQFKDATGLDLWTTLIRYMGSFSNSQSNGLSLADTLYELSNIIGFVDSAQLFFCVAKQSSKSITIEEIEDAMFHAGMLKSDRDSDMSEPYPFVLYQLALDVYEYHAQLSKNTKKH
jgi:hypothetical protein